MAKTRIIVLKLKKILRIAIPVALGLVFLIVFFAFFFAAKDSQKTDLSEQITPTMATYRAGVYNSVIALNDSYLNLEVVVDTDHINSVRLVNLDEATSAMYPLMEPAIAEISNQLCTGIAPEEVVLSESSKYTQTLLLEGIKSTLEKAVVSEE